MVGVARTTIARELGIEPLRPMSLTMAQRLGLALGFDPAYVALAHARDVVGAQLHSNRDDEQMKKQLRYIWDTLAGYVRDQSPFRREDLGRRLAFRAERCRRGISAERVERAAKWGIRLSPMHIRRYEANFASIRESCLQHLLDTVSELSPNLEKIGLEGLEREARKLSVTHYINDTTEWRDYRDTPLGGRQILCPYEDGYKVLVGASPTLWNTMDVGFIKAIQPKRVARSRVRMMGIQPRGVQVGILAQGSVRLTLKENPFPAEEPERYYDYPKTGDGVLHQRIYQRGDVIIAPGSYFYRIEFLAPTSLVVVLNLRENLFLKKAMVHSPGAY
jgi:hypothetical protein